MVGIWDGLPVGDNKGFINAPLVSSAKKLPKEYHSSATKQNFLGVKTNASGFKKLMKKLGKSKKGGGVGNVDFMVYNDVAREGREGEADLVYYAKFMEYGFTSRSGRFIPGLRLMDSTKNEFKHILIEEYKKMPNKFNTADVRKAFERACKRYILLLESISPSKSGALARSWKYAQR